MNIVGDNNSGNTQNGQQQGPPLTSAHLKDAEDIICEECECNIFEEKIMLKKVSKFITGNDRDSISPIPVIVCAKCNNINEMLKPQL